MDEAPEQVKPRQYPWKGVIYLAAGLLLVVWLLYTPVGLFGKADAIGYAVCHRIDARSFHLDDRQLPLCARCSGMYLGAVLGLVFQYLTSNRLSGGPSWRVVAVLAVLVGAFGVDGVNSYLHLFPWAPSLYEPQNWLRLLTGTGMGIVVAVVLFPAFNQTMWIHWDQRKAIRGLPSLGLLLALGLLLDLLVMTENPVFLYPLALISAAGVLALLTMVYSMVLVMLFKLENRFQMLRQMAIPLTGGFMMALAQIAILDLVRFYLTGTWSGFTIG
ncbi:MAG: DUF2085 domain-containing protein [Chloroflexota bacterium]|nr:MAG: DUF2085 domain-containing protein [Chloroflexota bacterium]